MDETRELVDIYGNVICVVIERNTNTALPQSMYHVSVDIWVKRKDGKILLTQRHSSKAWGMQWECSGGAIVKGESIHEDVWRSIPHLKNEIVLAILKCLWNGLQVCWYAFINKRVKFDEIIVAKCILMC